MEGDAYVRKWLYLPSKFLRFCQQISSSLNPIPMRWVQEL